MKIIFMHHVCFEVKDRGVTPLSLATFSSFMITPPGPEVIKLFSCSTQLSMKPFLLLNVKMPTMVGILTFMSRKNNILCLPEPNKNRIS